MAKYITSIRDLMIQAYNNISDIKTKAKDGDPEACFQMGMIHLLGIKTPINFNKASSFLENQSLADDPDACRLLGFIGECEGNYSAAFKNFAQAAGSNSKRPYMNKVFEERSNLQGFFKKLVLPNTVLNKEVSAIINEYIKGGESKVDASLKLATICNDEITCLEAAQSLYDAGDLYSAKRWLQKGNVANTNELFITIENKLSDIKKAFILSDVLQVIDVEGNSLLADSNTSFSIFEIKNTCDNVAVACKKTWMEDVPNLIEKIGKRLDEEEKARIKKQKEEEAALRKKQEAEERKAQAEEEARKKKRNKKIKYGVIAALIILGAISALTDKKDNSDKETNKEEIVVSDNSDANSNDVSRSEAREEKQRKDGSSSTYQESDNSGYYNVLSERRLTDDDIADKTKKELEIMRNSIYARYGYKFKREDLLNHFSQYSWYDPTTSDMGTIYNMMNDNEKYNVDFIKKHE